MGAPLPAVFGNHALPKILKSISGTISTFDKPGRFPYSPNTKKGALLYRHPMRVLTAASPSETFQIFR
jgi:hypothetical protein